MGNHLLCLDPSYPHCLTNNPELLNPGVPFSHMWIFGVQGGQLSYWEPMIALSYLQSLQDPTTFVEPNSGTVSVENGKITVTKSFPLPERAPTQGFYPSTYKMSYDTTTQSYTVSLLDFVFLPKTKTPSTDVCPGDD